VGDGFGVSALAEDPEHPSGGDGTEEVLQVEVYDDGVAGVPRGIGDSGAAWPESVGGVVGRYVIQDLADQDATRA
jgi:hypothetical protein